MIRDILLDYEKLLHKSIQLGLDDSQLISFEFKIGNFAHLIGLHKLGDISVIQKLNDENNKFITAKSLYLDIKNEIVSDSEFEASQHYSKIKSSRLDYFSSDRLWNLLKSRNIIHFSPKKVVSKKRDTKLEKIDYIFFETIEIDGQEYINFCLAFENVKSVSYPATFFLEQSDFYIHNQDIVNILSVYIKDGSNEEFNIYWDNVRTSMVKNSHYKFLKKMEDEVGFITEELHGNMIDSLQTDEEVLENIRKHFKLLQLEEVQKVYIPYIPEAGKWSNAQKRFVLDKLIADKIDYSPREVLEFLKICNNK